MKLANMLIVFLISAFIAGCASVMSGTTQQVTFQSSPDDALVSIDGRPIGKTPLTIQLDKKKGQTITVEKEGFKKFQTSMDTRLDSWFWGNILIGGVIGSTTDSINGSVYEYSQGQYFITLEKNVLASIGVEKNISEKEEVRRFLYINYVNIQKDFSRNEGEYLEATLSKLGAENGNRDEIYEDVKSKLFSSSSASEFIEHTVSMYIKE